MMASSGMPFFIFMNTILNIRLKSENFVIIEFDNLPPLTVPKLLVYEMGLRKGDLLMEEMLESLNFENELYLCEQKALFYLGKRLHSTIELKRKLYQKKFSKKVIEPVILKMKALTYLDDKKYSELLVNESLNLRHDGLQKIKARLIEKGIAKELIAEVLSYMLNDEIEADNIKLTADRKLSSLKKRFTDKKEINQKLTAFLLSKGYSFAAIKNYFKDINQETDLNEEY